MITGGLAALPSTYEEDEGEEQQERADDGTKDSPSNDTCTVRAGRRCTADRC